MIKLKEIFSSLFHKNQQKDDLPKEINGIPFASLSEEQKEIIRAHSRLKKEFFAKKAKNDEMRKILDENIKKGLERSRKQIEMFQNLIDKNR